MQSLKKVPHHQKLIRQKRGYLRKLVKTQRLSKKNLRKLAKVTGLKFVAKKNLQYNPMIALWLLLP